MALEDTDRAAAVRVVIVEDDPKAGAAISSAVERALPGCSIVSLVDGFAEARDALQKTRPDVLVLDLELGGAPEGISFQALQDDVGDAAVVVLAGAKARRAGIDAVASGADDFLVKGQTGLERVGDAILVALARKRVGASGRHVAKRERLETAVRLGRGIAHHFNNINQITIGQAMHLLESTDVTPELQDGLEVIIRASQRSALLTRHLLEFTSAGTECPEIVDLGAVVHDMLPRIRGLIPSRVDLDVHVDRVASWVRLTRLDVEQILLTVTLNAIDAMPRQGLFSIRLSRRESCMPTEVSKSSQPDREHVVLSFSDTGEGMPPEVQERALEPFFTTKDVGQGAGIGLAAVDGIVRRAGGNVSVFSFPGRGTTIRLCLPSCTVATG